MSGLYEKLKIYGKKNICPMHMPGHKRKFGICKNIDITEIDGFDNLANPTGILKELQNGWAKAYNADKAFISINGSTGAILSAICGVCRKGDKIIMARNCHKAVYNAVKLMELECEYIFPEYDGLGIAKSISLESVEKAVDENPDATLIVLTSPTYEGVMSDIEGICRIAHEKNIPVFVDSAHGAHIKFMGGESPVEQGADIACISLHKTLPSMTQTALLILNEERIDGGVIKGKLNVFQTSSPSYVLMASVSECLSFVENEKERFERYRDNIEWFYGNIRLEKLELRKNDDLGKIVISTGKTDISGLELMEKLREHYGIELEMAYDNYALAMTSVCDRKQDFKRLMKALEKIDKAVRRGEKCTVKYPVPQKYKGQTGAVKTVLLKDATDEVCADYIYAYPPGVPIIAPFEVIDEDIVNYISNLEGNGIVGIADGKIKIYEKV